MSTQFRSVKMAILLIGQIILTGNICGQSGFDNSTRALYIFDLVAK